MRNIFRTTTFLAILAAWLWSTAFATIKIGMQYQSPLQFAGLRFIIAGLLVFVVYGRWHQFFIQVRKYWRFVTMVSFLQIIGQYAVFYLGMELIPGALGAMLVGSSPLFIATVAHFALPNDKLTRPKLFSIMVGVIGIAIITLGRSKVQLKGELEWLGILLLMLNNIFSGLSNVMVSKSSRAIAPVFLSASSLFFGGLVLWLIALPFEGINLGPFPAEYYLSLGWLGFLSAAAISIWYTLLSRPGVKVSELNTWKFLIPVSGALLAWILIPAEKPDLISLIGMAIIAVSLVMLGKANHRQTVA